jgi:hypothetical protein
MSGLRLLDTLLPSSETEEALMMNRISPMRRHSRFPVRWPLLYGGDEFIAEGTVLDVAHIGWRIAGPMPVSPGMRLKLHLRVPERAQPITVERAAVLWVSECEFAIDVQEMEPADRAWLTKFLNEKLSLAWQSSPTDLRRSSAHEPPTPRTEPLQTVEGNDPRTPSEAQMMHLFLAVLANSSELEDALIQRCVDVHGLNEEEAAALCRRFTYEVWQPAQRVLRGMAAQPRHRRRAAHDITLN